MLQRCPPEEKENTGNEILKICRSLYETKHMLPAEVSFNLGYRGDESCFGVLTTRKMLPYQWRANKVIRGVEHNTCRETERIGFTLSEEEVAEGDHTAVFKYTDEETRRGDGASLFAEMLSGRTRDNRDDSHYVQREHFSPLKW